MAFAEAYQGKRVLLTGHTGFKGAWLAEWLLLLGAEVTGLALPPVTDPALFEQLALRGRVQHHEGDVRDFAAIRQVIDRTRPDFVFHLAAQALVRFSYQQPLETYAINVMGTANLLEALRLAGLACSVVVVTTDKCYENKEWVHGYREEDALGGRDPYSSSKAAAELVVGGYRQSYFSNSDSMVRLASARGGNVIGGGDWALDRLVPDAMRSLQAGASIPVRHPRATRPWQHVLECLSGYLCLGARLAQDPASEQLRSAFNFGPSLYSNRTVSELIEELLKHWPGHWEDCGNPAAVHEATLLNLTTDKAFHYLRWQPVWDFARAIEQTVVWYRQVAADAATAPTLTRRQIAHYTEQARFAGLAWAV